MNDHLIDGVLVRAAVSIGLAVSTGPVLWAAIIEGRTPPPLARWQRATTIASLGFAAVLAIVQATFAFAERWSWRGASTVLADTSYGRALVAHVAVSALHALALWARPPAVASAVLTSAGLALTTVTLLGHASVQSVPHVGVQAVHAAAAIAWLGLLVVLMEQIARRALAHGALRRVSRVAAILVSGVVVTGAARTGSFLGGERAPLWTAVLALKLALFVGVLAVARTHRRSGFHGLAAGPTDPAWRRFGAVLTVEVWLLVCVVLLAALLSQVPPP